MRRIRSKNESQTPQTETKVVVLVVVVQLKGQGKKEGTELFAMNCGAVIVNNTYIPLSKYHLNLNEQSNKNAFPSF